MPESFIDLVLRLCLTAETIAKVTGVSERTARSWLIGERHAPETARRLILIVCDNVPPEEFLK